MTTSATKTTTTSVTSTTSTTSTIPNVNVTVDSYPQGAGLVTVDGNPIVTPMVFGWQVGSTHALSAVGSLSCGPSCQFLFQSWTDGGGQTHTITTPNSPTYILAVYHQQQQTTTQSYSTTTTYTTSSTTFSTSSTSTTTHGPDFALSVAPSTASLPQDDFVGSTDFTLTLTSISGWRGDVQFTTSQLPPGVTLSNMPSAYSFDTPFASWNVEVNIAASAQAGSYQIQITATSGPLTHTASITVQVQGSTVRNIV
jgi:hypothetical protein